MLVVITFFSLVAVSLTARLFDKGKYKHNFIVFTLKYAPLVCAFMGASFVLALICCNQIVRFFSLSASAGLFLVQMLAVIAIMIGFGFYRSLALRRNFSMLKTCLSFVLGFAFSLALSLAIFAAGMFAYFNSFQHVKVHPDYSFQMRLKPLFAMCPEYDRSIVFASGKTVGIHMDTCRLSDFKVYKLNGGMIYLECQQHFGNSYVIDEKSEKVYARIGDGIAEMKDGGYVDGMDIASDSVVYYTHGKPKSKPYRSPIRNAAGLFESKSLLGSFSPRGFVEK